MVRSARLSASLALIGALFLVFAVGAAVEHRWRDATEGGVPAVLLIAAAVFVAQRALSKR